MSGGVGLFVLERWLNNGGVEGWGNELVNYENLLPCGFAAAANECSP